MRSRILTACVVLVVLSTALAAQASIQDRAEYRPSTGLTIGTMAQEWGEEWGYAIVNPFQINLLYQPGIEDSDINAFNDYGLGSGDLNFPDNDEYVLTVNPAGGLQVHTYPNIDALPDPNIQWMITGWNQTIFAGSIVGQPDGTLFLKVDPTQGYRSFPTDPPVNDLEVFGGIILSEVVGYTFDGNLDEFGPGSVLGVQMAPAVPEPASLLIWGLLGATCLGGVFFRRRK